MVDKARAIGCTVSTDMLQQSIKQQTTLPNITEPTETQEGWRVVANCKGRKKYRS